MTKGTVAAIIFLTIIITIAGAIIFQGRGQNLYRNALGNSIHEVLVREGYILPQELPKRVFQKDIVNKVIQPSQPIATDAEIERQADLVLRELITHDFHKMPINQEFIMNVIKIEYHVMHRGKKVSRMLQTED